MCESEAASSGGGEYASAWLFERRRVAGSDRVRLSSAGLFRPRVICELFFEIHEPSSEFSAKTPAILDCTSGAFHAQSYGLTIEAVVLHGRRTRSAHKGGIAAPVLAR
jgi:hypothetical protein